MSQSSLDVQIQTLPQQPGVYQYFDADKRLIYVGKAKDIKKRVSSYFTKHHDYGKTRMLVKNIATIKHIVVATETDALLLENNLIKKHQPKYNVMLKDDKSYPWICIKNERFPRVFPTRRIIKDGSEYFGPYTSMKTVRTLLDLVKASTSCAPVITISGRKKWMQENTRFASNTIWAIAKDPVKVWRPRPLTMAISMPLGLF
jgi:excinuclease ABC subunit C